jgi:hypothetical protein
VPPGEKQLSLPLAGRLWIITSENPRKPFEILAADPIVIVLKPYLDGTELNPVTIGLDR